MSETRAELALYQLDAAAAREIVALLPPAGFRSVRLAEEGGDVPVDAIDDAYADPDLAAAKPDVPADVYPVLTRTAFLRMLFTTARDMSILARHIIRRYPERYKLFSARSIRWRGQVRPNHNQLLGRVRSVDGVKTGYTVPAGYNLAASSLRSRRRVIVVVLGARTAAARDLLVSNLLESDFSSSAVGKDARMLRAGRSLPHIRR